MTDTSADPRLSHSEWRAVSSGLRDAAKCGCGDLSGSWMQGLSRIARRLTGRDEPAPLADPRLDALRNFVCTTQRRRRRADEYVPELIAQGFNRRQVEAITLLTV